MSQEVRFCRPQPGGHGDPNHYQLGCMGHCGRTWTLLPVGELGALGWAWPGRGVPCRCDRRGTVRQRAQGGGPAPPPSVKNSTDHATSGCSLERAAVRLVKAPD